MLPSVPAATEAAVLYANKKAITTEIGAVFQEILAQFEKARHLDEKKRVGSDMTNASIGHMIRGRFRAALTCLLSDGLKPYLFEGLVLTDVWTIVTSFCKEGETEVIVCVCGGGGGGG